MNAVVTPPRLEAWLFTTDARRIGRVHLVAAALALVAGLVAALGIQAERLTTGPTLLGPEGFVRLTAAHGLLMVHLLLVPALPTVLGNLLLPAELGLENVAFPRLNRASLWLFLAGALVALGGLAGGGLQHWAFDTQLGAVAPTPTLWAMVGVTMLMLSAMLTGLNFLVSMHIRPGTAPLSLFAWGLRLMAWVHLLAAPIFALTTTVVFAERWLGVGFFDPALGGDPGLYRQFAWFAGHATLTAALLPAAGLALDRLADAATRPTGSRRFAVGALIALAVLGVSNWGQHLFMRGQSAMAAMVFSLFGLLAVVPATGLVLHGVRTLVRGGLRFTPAALWATAFVLLFAGGTVASLLMASVGTGGLLAASTFSAGQLHTFVAGGVIFAFMAGLHGAWPQVTGRTDATEPPGARIAAGLSFTGASLAFLPMFVAGLSGMPGRMSDALPTHPGLHSVAFMGGLTLAAGLALAIFGLWWTRGGAPRQEPAVVI
jgi:cytochrome c oxidase subunit 1